MLTVHRLFHGKPHHLRFSDRLAKLYSVGAIAAWPGSYVGALSLTFDDARPSQLSIGLSALDTAGVRATFYLSNWNVRNYEQQWRQVAADGHELGSHTLRHPCTGNYRWSRDAALESLSLDDMASELAAADSDLEESIGFRPKTFAYPCGQTYVGRGASTQSYVPLVAKRFLAGRLGNQQFHNDPDFCDLAQVGGFQFDGQCVDSLRPAIESTLQCGDWLVLIGHEVDESGGVSSSAIRDVCEYATDVGLWIAPVQDVAQVILDWQSPRNVHRIRE